MLRRIAVTGASGRIGRAICRRLSRHYHVVGLDRLASPTAHITGDVGDEDLLCHAFTGADAVIHCAALHAPHVGLVDDREFIRINVDGTRLVVEAMRRCGVPRLVFTSTTAIYGLASSLPERAAWINEATQPVPRTIYHQTKLAAEALLQDAAGPGLTVRVIRMSRCFPEPAPVMAVDRLHRGVDARDVASAHELALHDKGPAFAGFVISAATPFWLEDVLPLKRDAASVIEARAPALAAEFRARGWRLPQSIDRVYDPSHAQRVLGWQPRYGAEAVLAMLDAGSPEVLPANNSDEQKDQEGQGEGNPERRP